MGRMTPLPIAHSNATVLQHTGATEYAETELEFC
jgi:hypothetical protein